jgi:murein DD-endopeptidase MepM/ murein hydrolase activator NlpD
MKKWIPLFISCLFTAGCFGTGKMQESDMKNPKMDRPVEQQEQPFFIDTFSFIRNNQHTYVSVDEFTKAIKSTYQYDEMNKTLSLMLGQATFTFIFGVPVYEKGGEYFPIDREIFSIFENKPYLSSDFLVEALGAKVEEMENTLSVSISKNPIEVPASTIPSKTTSVEEITTILSVLHNPIVGASVSTVPSHLPGAVRSYRHGIHEGMDFYQYTSNVAINRDTAIYGMAEGKVVRADHDYIPYSSEEERNKDLSLAAGFPITPQYMLDKLRGKQVWISYPNGILARFCHLDRIPESITVGDTVTEETIIGFVGNSGTSGEVKKNDSELHLHLDLLIHNELFWKGLSQEDVRTILNSVFEKTG